MIKSLDHHHTHFSWSKVFNWYEIKIKRGYFKAGQSTSSRGSKERCIEAVGTQVKVYHRTRQSVLVQEELLSCQSVKIVYTKETFQPLTISTGGSSDD